MSEKSSDPSGHSNSTLRKGHAVEVQPPLQMLYFEQEPLKQAGLKPHFTGHGRSQLALCSLPMTAALRVVLKLELLPRVVYFCLTRPSK
jgi:hypothetical protein